MTAFLEKEAVYNMEAYRGYCHIHAIVLTSNSVICNFVASFYVF